MIEKGLRRNKYLFYLMKFFQELVFFTPIIIVYYSTKGLNVGNISALKIIFLVSVLAFEIPLGLIADKIGYKKMIVLSNLITVSYLIVMYLSKDFLGIIIYTIIKGIAKAGRLGSDSALIYKSTEHHKSEKVFGIYQSFGILGAVTAYIITGFLVKISFKLTILLTLIFNIISLILSLGLKDVEHEKRHSNKKTPIREIIEDIKNRKEILFFIVATGLIAENSYLILDILKQLQYVRSGVDIGLFGLIFVVSQIIGIFMFKTYDIVDKINKKKALKGLSVIFIMCNLALLMTQNWLVSVITLLVIEVLTYLILPIIKEVQNNSIRSKSNHRAAILSFYGLVRDFIKIGILILIIGFGRNSVFDGLIICFIMSVISLILVSNLKKSSLNE